MKTKAILLGAALVAGAGSIANANATVGDFADLAHKDDRVGFEVLANGITWNWTNEMLTQRKQPILFCAPQKLAVAKEQYLQVLDEYLAANPEAKALQLVAWPRALLSALQETFPCPEATL